MKYNSSQIVFDACAKEREQANDVNVPRFNVVGYLVIAVFAVAIVLVVDLVRRLI